MSERFSFEIYRPEFKEEVLALISEHGERRLRSHSAYLLGDKTGWRGWVARGIDDGPLLQKIVGFTAYNPDSPDFDSVTVINRNCRQGGLASGMLSLKLMDAHDLGLHKFITTIGATNAPSINMVLKRGFTLVHAETKEYGTILKFELELNR